MAQDFVGTDDVPFPIDRDHGHVPKRGGRRRVIAENYLRRKR